jgi:hypothetical protein
LFEFEYERRTVLFVLHLEMFFSGIKISTMTSSL